MQILVSFCNLRATDLPALGLLDPVTLEIRVLDLPAEFVNCRGVTGLSTSKENLYVVAQRLAEPGDERSRGRSVLFVLDRGDLSLRSSYAFRSASDVHSLCCQGETVYVVSTGSDEIVRLEVRDSEVISEVTHWRPDNAAPRQDIHHLNAIAVRGDDLLVAGFGKKNGSLWESARSGFILNLNTGDEVASNLDQPHSLACTSDGVVYCESRQKAVRVVGDRRHQYLPGYTRGICAIGRDLYVGTSIGRQVSKSTGTVNNPANGGARYGACTISRLCATDFSIVGTITLDEYASEVYELLSIEGTEQWPTIPDVAWRRHAILQLASTLDDRTRWARRAEDELAERNDEIVQLRANKQADDETRSHMRVLRDAVENQGRLLDELSVSVNVLSEIAAQSLARWMPDFQEKAKYLWMSHRLRGVVEQIVARDSYVLIASKGDDALLQIPGRSGWHFPRSESGAYTGNHPSCSLSAIAHLEALRALGASHLVIPASSLWWLDHYADFRRHLAQQYAEVFRQDDTCIIYSLAKRKASDDANTAASSLRDAVLQCRKRLGDDVALLDWNAGIDLGDECPELCVFSPPGEVSILPYFDHSVDIVAIRETDRERYDEARRVASAAVLELSEPKLDSSRQSCANIEWLKDGLGNDQVAPRVTLVIGGRARAGDFQTLMSALQASLPHDFRGEIFSAEPWGQSPEAAGDGHCNSAAADVHGHNGRVQPIARPLSEATGDILVFVNDGTVPLADWLPPLLGPFQRCGQVGNVAGRLVGGDGRLQSAGGVIFADASVVGFGEGDFDPEAPLFEFVRQVDCCMGPFLATRRSLFEALQGFDPGFQSLHFKFADYCLRARELGYLTIYQPEARIVSLLAPRGDAEARCPTTSFAEADAERFREKWLHKLRMQPVPPRSFDREAWHSLAASQAWHGVRQS